MSDERVPSLFDWAGGMPALERLTTRFYQRVRQHEQLREIFARIDAHHPHFVAQFLAEVLGGPTTFCKAH